MKSGNIYETIWFYCFHNFLMLHSFWNFFRPLDLNLREIFCLTLSPWRQFDVCSRCPFSSETSHLECLFALLNHISKMFPGRCYNNIQTIYLLIHSGFSGAYTQKTINTQCCPDDTCVYRCLTMYAHCGCLVICHLCINEQASLSF